MTDYQCPSCDGGFPADDHDDACPWCGEEMAGGSSGSTHLTSRLGQEPFRQQTNCPPGTVGSGLPDLDELHKIDRDPFAFRDPMKARRLDRDLSGDRE